MTRQATLGLSVLVVLLVAAVLLYRAPSVSDHVPGRAPDFFQDLTGEWNVTVRMRDASDADWKEFKTGASIEPLFQGEVLRERAADTSKPWRELAFTRWDASEGKALFEHLFSGSLSMLRMSGAFDPETRTIHYSGEWHRQQDGGLLIEPASGQLTVDSHDRHVWRLDEHRDDGSTFVDLEMIYERVE